MCSSVGYGDELLFRSGLSEVLRMEAGWAGADLASCYGLTLENTAAGLGSAADLSPVEGDSA